MPYNTRRWSLAIVLFGARQAYRTYVGLTKLAKRLSNTRRGRSWSFEGYKKTKGHLHE